MKDIETLLIPILLNNTINKLKFSLDDLKKNHEHRKDLIDSTNESIKDLTDVLRYVREVDLERRSLGRDVFNYSNQCLDLKLQVNKLTESNKEINEILNKFMV